MAITRRAWLSSCFSLLPAWAQQPSFTAEVRVVNVLATVRDKQGRIVRDLPKDKFTLLEDGQPRDIQYFSQHSDLPLTLGLLVDTSNSQRRLIGEERLASWKFFQQVLREDKDQSFLIHFDFDVELLADLTTSKKRLQDAIDKLETVSRPAQLQRRVEGRDPGARRRSGGGTNLYDSVLLASDELMRKQTGRKAIILLTDGVDTGSRTTLNDAIEAAQRADTLVYAIHFYDERSYGSGGNRNRRKGQVPGIRLPDGRKVLTRIASETGGVFFEVSKKLPLDEVYRRIEEELRNQYNLGFTPDPKSEPGSFHPIKLSTSDKNLLVHTRAGYYTSR